MAVRTPMQWTAGRNGGFSTARPSRLAAPIVTGGYGPEHVNVEAQRRDPDSLLAFVTLLARRYRECPELGWGTFEVLEQPDPAVLAHRSTWDDASTVALHNLSAEATHVSLRLDGCDEETRLVDWHYTGLAGNLLQQRVLYLDPGPQGNRASVIGVFLQYRL